MDQPISGESVQPAYQYGSLTLPHGQLPMPVFMPDATLGVVRAVDATDLLNCEVQALVMNTFHLTPEKTIQLQVSYGADVVIGLDECTHVDASLEMQEISVKRTIDWARRCKKEFLHQVNQRRLKMEQRPLLFAVIQGGRSHELRKRCANELLEIGFDGFGYGGWPLDGQGHLLTEIITYTRELVPRQFPMHALGIGHPVNVVDCAKIGYGIFDSAMPTRDARHSRLYSFAAAAGLQDKWFSYVYVNDDKHIKSDAPVSSFCDCLCCRNYSLGYLNHLFKINDTLFFRLATIHNLRLMTLLTERLRENRDGQGE